MANATYQAMERRVREAEARVAQQRSLVCELRDKGDQSARYAEQLLVTFEKALCLLKQHRDRGRQRHGLGEERLIAASAREVLVLIIYEEENNWVAAAPELEDFTLRGDSWFDVYANLAPALEAHCGKPVEFRLYSGSQV